VHRETGAPVLREDPTFLRVRLADVDDEEMDTVAVLPRELLERPDLGAERRSGI
jgi:hypothetical protein